MTFRLEWTAAAFCGAALCSGCPSSPACVPGSTQACLCGVRPGSQVCASDGASWGACDCDMHDSGVETDTGERRDAGAPRDTGHHDHSTLDAGSDLADAGNRCAPAAGFGPTLETRLPVPDGLSVDQEFFVTAIADLNGDGFRDVLVDTASPNGMFVAVNSGHGRFEMSYGILWNPRAPFGCEAADGLSVYRGVLGDVEPCLSDAAVRAAMLASGEEVDCAGLSTAECALATCFLAQAVPAGDTCFVDHVGVWTLMDSGLASTVAVTHVQRYNSRLPGHDRTALLVTSTVGGGAWRLHPHALLASSVRRDRGSARCYPGNQRPLREIACTNTTTEVVSIVARSGTVEVFEEGVAATPFWPTVDITGDGVRDYEGANAVRDGHAVQWLGLWPSSAGYAVAPFATWSARVMDVNRDGALDVLASSNQVLGAVALSVGPASGSWQYDDVVLSFNPVGIADMDGDCQVDYFGVAGTFAPITGIGDGFSRYYLVASSVGPTGAPGVTIRAGGGLGEYPSSEPSTYGPLGALDAVDLNNDGRLDFVRRSPRPAADSTYHADSRPYVFLAID
jgi:hypothetical protein